MRMNKNLAGFAKTTLTPIALVFASVTAAQATVFTGTLYYTTYAGGANVWNISYNYNDVSHVFGLGAPNNIATTNGADGIIFASNGNLLIGGQGSGNVYELNSSGTVVNTQNTGTPSYHLTLDPTGTKVYTSDFGGRLNTLSTPIGSGNTPTSISGGDRGLTQIAFGDGGAVFYVNGAPNGGGNLGTIDLSTGTTTRIYTGITPAHGLVYDPFTDLITMFGAGQTGSMNATDGTGLKTSGGGKFAVTDFDQGAVDGKGHALVAGGSSITFIDYSLSHDITAPDYTTSIGGFAFIDDLAPLVGAGSRQNSVPEPASIALLGMGLLSMGVTRRKNMR